MKYQRYMRCWLLGAFILSFYLMKAQNLLNNGGFENMNSGFSESNAPCEPSDYDGYCTPGGRARDTYYSQCPGGSGKVQRGLQNWIQRGAIGYVNGDCTFCEMHCPDWIYNPFVVSGVTYSYGGDFSVQDYSTPYGKSCVAAYPYELFQQQLAAPITIPGTYYLSALVYTGPSSTWAKSSYTLQYILSTNQTDYNDDGCNASGNGLTTLNNADVILTKTINKSDPMIDWQPIEFQLPVTSGNYNWFSINIDAAGDIDNNWDADGPYFAFDEVYISNAACYCPLIRNVSNQTFTDIQTGAEAQEYLNLVTANSVLTDGSNPVNVLFTAGDAITITPGFNTEPGVTAEIQIANCFSNAGVSSFCIPNPYSSCIGTCDGAPCTEICFYTSNIINYNFTITDPTQVLGPPLLSIVNGQVNTGVWNYNEYCGSYLNRTCVTIPGQYTDGNLDYTFSGSGCNGGTVSTSGTLDIVDLGCIDGKREVDSLLTTPAQDSIVSIYPDPFCRTITIYSPSYTINDEVSIRDARGAKIETMEITGISTLLNLENMEDGIYLVSYKGVNCSITKKIVKSCN